ncbi:3-deoxy-D-manno-octulosonic acid transferase [Desulfoplanes sp.]
MKRFFSTALYTLAWTLALPLVFLNKRLREHWLERFGWGIGVHAHDLWIQAASVGEAFLAISLAEHLRTNRPGLSILITTNTSQGFTILNEHFPPQAGTSRPEIRVCPLDHPWIIALFMRRTRPNAVVLLETELWPGILGQCKKRNCPVLVANARMSPKSFSGYLRLRPVLRTLGPQEIMAISPADASRFAMVFQDAHVSTMPNIKFDRIGESPAIPYVANPLSRFFRPSARIVALGSIREEEEPAIRHTLTRIVSEHPTTIVALVPRHLHRIDSWKAFLKAGTIPWLLRSELDDHVKPGTVVLWDLFGELQAVYALAKAAFVGGTLVPLGGQNFLEPLAQGVRPVIGPYWKNFHWVGQDLMEQGLVTVVHGPEELAKQLGASATISRENVRAAADAYLSSRKGGTAKVAQKIAELLQ